MPVSDLTELIVDVVGISVGVRAPRHVLSELTVALSDLAPGEDPIRQLVLDADPDGRFRLLDAGAPVLIGIAPEVAAATVVWRLNAIASTSARHVAIHAGCVSGTGAVLLPGRSGAGKSTLVAACITAGMAYLSDEYAMIDIECGDVTPYAKPLGLDGERLVAARNIRAGSAGIPIAPAAIVFPRFEHGASTSVTPLDPGWTLLSLAAHTTNLGVLGGSALPWLAGLAIRVPPRQVTYSDTAAATAIVMAAAAAPAITVRPAPMIEPVTTTTTTVMLGNDLAVFHEPTARIHLLNASASFVWTCVPEASDLTQLTDTALALAPTGSLDRTTAAATVDQLARFGLLPATAS